MRTCQHRLSRPLEHLRAQSRDRGEEEEDQGELPEEAPPARRRHTDEKQVSENSGAFANARDVRFITRADVQLLFISDFFTFKHIFSDCAFEGVLW